MPLPPPGRRCMPSIMVCEKPDLSGKDTMRDTSDKKAFFRGQINDNMGSLFLVAMYLTRNGADAEDLVAATATKAWAAIESLADEDSFLPWIFRILHSCYISDYRKERGDRGPSARSCTAMCSWPFID